MLAGKSRYPSQSRTNYTRTPSLQLATSASTEVAEDILSYFVDIGNKECFAATLFVCFDLLRPDVVEELSWQHGLNDFYMPYKIQVARTMRERLAALEKEVRERSKKEIAKEEQEAEQPIINPGINRLLITQGNGYPSQAPPMVNGTGMTMGMGVGMMPVSHSVPIVASNVS
ncbi:hypothetical protein EDD15DRAFT_622463 [Pisolithus albus]|nr:hypothetical protein EDD15DRAFT_622463 [Pisolithus albus]